MKISEYRKLVTGKSKYGNCKTAYKGVTYMSKKEANYAMALDAMKKRGDIISYTCQVPFQITINNIKCFKYLLDFEVKYSDGHIEYVDVKGFRTKIYRLKKKCVEAQYSIKITEV